MDIERQFNIPRAIKKFEREQAGKQARREKSTRNMFSHRPVGQMHPQLFCIAEMERFRKLLPKCVDSDEISRGLHEEEMYLITETVIRSNRELIEFHNLDNVCPRCLCGLTECPCRELTKVETLRLVQEIHLAIRKLYLQGFLAIVYISEDGLCRISNAREKCAPQFFPIYGMGTGFSIYAENYHIKPPD